MRVCAYVKGRGSSACVLPRASVFVVAARSGTTNRAATGATPFFAARVRFATRFTFIQVRQFLDAPKMAKNSSKARGLTSEASVKTQSEDAWLAPTPAPIAGVNLEPEDTWMTF